MRRLMLLRHAKSDWSRAGLSDHDRPLNARGREAAPKIGAYMMRHALVPDLIIASTATRVRETLDLMLAAFESAPKVTYDARAYEAGASALLDVLRETPRDIHSLLLVGHNPGLAELAMLLVATGNSEASARLADKFPTGALAVIGVALDDWAKMRPRSGRLDRFIVPKGLKGEID
jgi:phosphohistidine phosphatase